MRSEVEYNIPASLPEDPAVKVIVDWSIVIEIEDNGEEVDIIIKGDPLAVRVEVGDWVLPWVRPASEASKKMQDWIAARAKDLNPDVIGLSRKECFLEAYEQEMGTDDN